MIIAIGAGALAAPFGSLAQLHSRVWRIGSMGDPLSVPPRTFDRYRDNFSSEMRKLGHTQGTHFTLEGGEARIDSAGMPAVAAELVRNKAGIIIAFGGAAAIAARTATTSIPIIFIGVNDPVEEGFATSSASPGGNITGTCGESD